MSAPSAITRTGSAGESGAPGLPGSAARYRLIGFDFDGTIADSMGFFHSSIGEVARAHGFRQPAPDELEAMRSLGSREIIARLGIRPWKLPRIVRDFRRLMAARIGQVSAFEGMRQALTTLHARGATLALVTTNSEANVRAVLGDECCALFHHLDCGSAMFGKASRLRRIARRSGIRSLPLYVGDELRDAEAAREAGFAFAAVGWGYTHLAALETTNPQHVLRHPGELASLA